MTNVTKLRSKVVEIEAMQFVGGAENATPIINWVLENGGTARYHEAVEEKISFEGDMEVEGEAEYIAIQTIEGTMKADAGWWVFRGLEGEFYPCKDSVKQNKYEEI